MKRRCKLCKAEVFVHEDQYGGFFVHHKCSTSGDYNLDYHSYLVSTPEEALASLSDDIFEGVKNA